MSIKLMKSETSEATKEDCFNKYKSRGGDVTKYRPNVEAIWIFIHV